jgi:trehalose 6-phosphate phosphatase
VPPETEEKLDEFFGGFADGANPLLLLDYDGTLAPFRLDRFKARPWAGVRERLNLIQRQKKTRMAAISGRPAAEVAALLALEAPIEVWGLHGAERLYPDGRRELEKVSDDTLKKLDELRRRLKQDSLGGLFEGKPNAAVMHWRGAPPEEAGEIERRTRALFEPLARMEGLALLKFEAGLELRAGRDKGGAVEAILQEAGAGGPVSFLGDDLTDEAAFRVVNSTKGSHLSVLVRRAWRETAADIWLRPPDELRKFLDRWIARMP